MKVKSLHEIHLNFVQRVTPRSFFVFFGYTTYRLQIDASNLFALSSVRAASYANNNITKSFVEVTCYLAECLIYMPPPISLGRP